MHVMAEYLELLFFPFAQSEDWICWRARTAGTYIQLRYNWLLALLHYSLYLDFLFAFNSPLSKLDPGARTQPAIIQTKLP